MEIKEHMISQLWARFQSFFTKQGITVADLGFQPGAKEAEIGHTEYKIGLPFPADFREFLTLCNGQDVTKLKWLPDYMTLLSVKEIEKMWEDELSGLQQNCSSAEQEKYYNFIATDGKIRGTIFHARRIPIATYEGAVCTLYLDFIPGPKGTPGQLIYNMTECDFIVLTNDIQNLLALYVTLLETGQLHLAVNENRTDYKFVLQDIHNHAITGATFATLRDANFADR